MSVESIDRMVQEMSQLHQKKGTYYNKWFKNYKKSVLGHCRKIAKNYKRPRWLVGMERFIQHEQTKINKKE